MTERSWSVGCPGRKRHGPARSSLFGSWYEQENVRQIGILLFPEVEELDAVGPWEVLSHWTLIFPEDKWAAFCSSAEGKPVTCSKGLVIGSQVRGIRHP